MLPPVSAKTAFARTAWTPDINEFDTFTNLGPLRRNGKQKYLADRPRSSVPLVEEPLDGVQNRRPRHGMKRVFGTRARSVAARFRGSGISTTRPNSHARRGDVLGRVRLHSTSEGID